MKLLLLLGVLLLTTVSALKDFPSENGVSLVKVTNLNQLWRYRVAAGFYFGGDKIKICLVGPLNKGFVRNTDKAWVIADGSKCALDNMYEVARVSGDVFTIENIKRDQYWSCRDNGQLWGVKKVTSWEQFRLFVDSNGNNLTFRSAGWLNWYVYQWTDNYLYCSKKSSYYSGKTGFLGWQHWADEENQQ